MCASCGLRYPLTEGQTFGVRCPHCLGETSVVVKRDPKIENRMITKDTRQVSNEKGDLTVLLDNIRSGWNTGSILRSADGFGFSHAYLCGITPTPEVEAVTKTSLGAEETVTWSHHKDAVKLVKGLKKDGYQIWALEEAERAVSILSSHKLRVSKVVLIVGNEVTGVDPDLLDLCDTILYIPMRGEKRSFNVAIAFGVAAYQISS